MIKPKEGDYCIECRTLMTLVNFPDDPPSDPVILIQGEVDACCGDYDEEHHVNTRCINCCGPHNRATEIYDGKSTGGGFYIVTSR